MSYFHYIFNTYIACFAVIYVAACMLAWFQWTCNSIETRIDHNQWKTCPLLCKHQPPLFYFGHKPRCISLCSTSLCDRMTTGYHLTFPASARQHPSYGDCLEVKREYYQNCCVVDCVTQCSQSAAHLYQQFLQVQQIGFVTLGPLRCAIEAVA